MDRNKNGLAAFSAAVLLAAIVLSLTVLLIIGGGVFVATYKSPMVTNDSSSVDQ
jgi:hypothetical protein